MRRVVFLGDQLHPPYEGAGSLRPPIFFWSLTCARAVSETTTKCCMVMKLNARKFLHGRPLMLPRDLFAVANLVVTCDKEVHMHSVTFLLKNRGHLGCRRWSGFETSLWSLDISYFSHREFPSVVKVRGMGGGSAPPAPIWTPSAIVWAP